MSDSHVERLQLKERRTDRVLYADIHDHCSDDWLWYVLARHHNGTSPGVASNKESARKPKKDTSINASHAYSSDCSKSTASSSSSSASSSSLSASSYLLRISSTIGLISLSLSSIASFSASALS